MSPIEPVRMHVVLGMMGLLIGSGQLVSQLALQQLIKFCKTGPQKRRLHHYLTRLEKNNLIEVEKFDRKDRLYRLTDQGRLHILGGSDPLTRWGRPWDGKWRMVLFDLPMASNHHRKYLLRYLKNNGFGYLQKSVWITPHPIDQEREILNKGRIKVKSLILLESRPCTGESDSDLVENAWDFEEINRRYSNVLKILKERPKVQIDNHSGATDFLRWLTEERAAWLDVAKIDPMLPTRLLPTDYLGQKVWQRRMEIHRKTLQEIEILN